MHSSWGLITHWGRRQIYVTGMGILTVILFIIGILDVSTGKKGLWPSGGLCVFWLFIYVSYPSCIGMIVSAY